MAQVRPVLTQVLVLLLLGERGRQHGGQPRDEGLVVLGAGPARAAPPQPPLGRRLAGRPCASWPLVILYVVIIRFYFDETWNILSSRLLDSTDRSWLSIKLQTDQ